MSEKYLKKITSQKEDIMQTVIFYAVVIAGTCKLTSMIFNLIERIDGRC